MEVWQRSFDISSFYLTRSVDEALDFVERYGVRYIIVGRLERMYYENLYPCTPDPDGSGVVCDMSNKLDMPDWCTLCGFDLPVSDCAPYDPQVDPATLACPSGGLEKFERMAQMGLLREAFREGQTIIYEVVQ